MFLRSGRDEPGALLSCCLTSTEARWPIRDGRCTGHTLCLYGLDGHGPGTNKQVS